MMFGFVVLILVGVWSIVLPYLLQRNAKKNTIKAAFKQASLTGRNDMMHDLMREHEAYSIVLRERKKFIERERKRYETSDLDAHK